MSRTAPVDLNPFNSDHLALIGAACKAAGPEAKSAFESMGRAILSKDWPPSVTPQGWSDEIEKAFCDVSRCALAHQTTESPIHDALELIENALRAPKAQPGVLLSANAHAVDAALAAAQAEAEDWKAIEAWNATRDAVEITVLGPFRDDGTMYYLRANECQVRGKTRADVVANAATWCRKAMGK